MNRKEIEAARANLAQLKKLGFIGRRQAAVVSELMAGEEGQFFADKIGELLARAVAMPSTGETDGQGMQAIAQLRYFAGGSAVCYITEKDAGGPDDEKEEIPPQWQAFGWAEMFAGCGELGSVCLAEWLNGGAELDFHFEARPLAECREVAA